MSTLDNPIMENGDVKPGSIALRYGLIGGLVLIAIGLVMQLSGLVDPTDLDKPTNKIANILNYVIFAALAVLAIKAYRDANGGFVTFGKAFTVGILTMLVVAAITLVWSYVYFALIEPDLLEGIQDAAKEQMIDQRGMSEEDADQAMGMMSWMWNPVMMSVMAALGTVFAGLIISLIVAAIMKKNPPEVV